jgi:uracil-DNA glycosylase family 4
LPSHTDESAAVDLRTKISKIDSKIKQCKLCRLHESRTNAVPGDGKITDLDIMFVGEGPGRSEDATGKPFVGSAGRILDSMLKEAGLDRSEVYITNIVKCRPPKNRRPKDDEIETCTGKYLEKQIELLKPKLICTLGATALEYFTGETNMKENHGKKQTPTKKLGAREWTIYPTYHPAAVFRNNSVRELLRNDIKMIPSILEDLKKKTTTKSE